MSDPDPGDLPRLFYLDSSSISTMKRNLPSFDDSALKNAANLDYFSAFEVQEAQQQIKNWFEDEDEAKIQFVFKPFTDVHSNHGYILIKDEDTVLQALNMRNNTTQEYNLNLWDGANVSGREEMIVYKNEPTFFISVEQERDLLRTLEDPQNSVLEGVETEGELDVIFKLRTRELATLSDAFREKGWKFKHFGYCATLRFIWDEEEQPFDELEYRTRNSHVTLNEPRPGAFTLVHLRRLVNLQFLDDFFPVAKSQRPKQSMSPELCEVRNIPNPFDEEVETFRNEGETLKNQYFGKRGAVAVAVASCSKSNAKIPENAPGKTYTLDFLSDWEDSPSPPAPPESPKYDPRNQSTDPPLYDPSFPLYSPAHASGPAPSTPPRANHINTSRSNANLRKSRSPRRRRTRSRSPVERGRGSRNTRSPNIEVSRILRSPHRRSSHHKSRKIRSRSRSQSNESDEEYQKPKSSRVSRKTGKKNPDVYEKGYRHYKTPNSRNEFLYGPNMSILFQNGGRDLHVRYYRNPPNLEYAKKVLKMLEDMENPFPKKERSCSTQTEESLIKRENFQLPEIKTEKTEATLKFPAADVEGLSYDKAAEIWRNIKELEKYKKEDLIQFLLNQKSKPDICVPIKTAVVPKIEKEMPMPNPVPNPSTSQNVKSVFSLADLRNIQKRQKEAKDEAEKKMLALKVETKE